MPDSHFNVEGLSAEQVLVAREKYGANRVNYKKEHGLLLALKGLAKEPMVLLLLVTSCIYFISGKPGDGIFLASAIVVVAAISLYQDSRSRNALEKLKAFTQPGCKVIREGSIQEI